MLVCQQSEANNFAYSYESMDELFLYTVREVGYNAGNECN